MQKKRQLGVRKKRTETWNITLVYELLSQQVAQCEPDEALRID